jgi:hypothetical protein
MPPAADHVHRNVRVLSSEGLAGLPEAPEAKSPPREMAVTMPRPPAARRLANARHDPSPGTRMLTHDRQR